MAHRETTLFINGVIETMTPSPILASSITVTEGRITTVGIAPEPMTREEATTDNLTVVDLRGRTVIPGFVDSHQHLSIGALYPRWADLSTLSSEEELFSLLSDQARAEPDAPWIRGARWDGAASPVTIHRDLIDSFGFSRPVMISDMSLHSGVVDSWGLELLNIDAATPDPPAGVIGRDTGGRLSGHLIERAWSGGHELSLAGYDDPDRWGELIVERAQSLLRQGVTAVHDAACSPQAEAVYRSLARAGQLPVSVLGMPHAAAMLAADLGSRLEGPITGEGDEWFRVGPVKLFADGGQHAAVSASNNRARLATGIYFADISYWIPEIAQRGYRLAVHALGDFAIQGCLDAFEQVARRDPGSDHRFRIEHAVRPRSGQIAAMQSLGVVACVQPGLVAHYGDGITAAAGAAFGDRFAPLRSMLEAGVPLAASSDDPCAPLSPILNSRSGATRLTAAGAIFGEGQTMPVRELAYAYTAGSAYAGGQENERGSIAVGTRADLVVLDGPLDGAVPPSVSETWVGGELKWSAAQ